MPQRLWAIKLPQTSNKKAAIKFAAFLLFKFEICEHFHFQPSATWPLTIWNMADTGLVAENVYHYF